jgi:hypothetical protein
MVLGHRGTIPLPEHVIIPGSAHLIPGSARRIPGSVCYGNFSQALDLPHPFRAQTAVARGKSLKFPVSQGKTGNFAPIGAPVLSE